VVTQLSARDQTGDEDNVQASPGHRHRLGDPIGAGVFGQPTERDRDSDGAGER
jgi:hypothetical protein